MQYRLCRNPLAMLALVAIFTFILANRLPTREVKRKQQMSVLSTNLLIIAVIWTSGCTDSLLCAQS